MTRAIAAAICAAMLCFAPAAAAQPEWQSSSTQGSDRHGDMGMYALLEGSWSDPQHGSGLYSVLAEGALRRGRHNLYGRVELAARPEYERTSEFRYHHDDAPIDETRWLILSGGYGFEAVTGSASLRP